MSADVLTEAATSHLAHNVIRNVDVHTMVRLQQRLRVRRINNQRLLQHV